MANHHRRSSQRSASSIPTSRAALVRNTLKLYTSATTLWIQKVSARPKASVVRAASS